jgi:UDPglucose--hexose-1-phosphate uridylyltransferase
MHEIRIDPLSGLRTIVASGDAPAVAPAPPLPAEAVGEPLLRPDATDPPPQDNPDLFSALAARGTHERITHAAALADLEPGEALAAVATWRERMRAHEGASYVHLGVDEPAAHADLIALDFVPAAVARERERFAAHAVRTMGANLLEDLVAEEVRRRERIVAIDDEGVLLCPYASRHPFQLMLAPRRPRERFQDDGPTAAALLHRGLRLLRDRFGSSPPLSLWIRTAPRGADRFCWRIDVVPRLTHAGGLELGTGLAHNPVAPEQAAAELRALLA